MLICVRVVCSFLTVADHTSGMYHFVLTNSQYCWLIDINGSATTALRDEKGCNGRIQSSGKLKELLANWWHNSTCCQKTNQNTDQFLTTNWDFMPLPKSSFPLNYVRPLQTHSSRSAEYRVLFQASSFENYWFVCSVSFVSQVTLFRNWYNFMILIPFSAVSFTRWPLFLSSHSSVDRIRIQWIRREFLNLFIIISFLYWIQILLSKNKF